MRKEKLSLIVPLVVHLVSVGTLAYYGGPDFHGYYCNNTYGNNSNTNTYKTNLNKALSSLLSNTQNHDHYHGFYNVSVGQEPDRANTMALCQGDMGIQDCRKCVNDLVTELPSICPMQKQAIGWYGTDGNCTLRYSNQSMFGNKDEFPMRKFHNINNDTDPVLFNKTLFEVLKNLQAKSASGNSQLKFATTIVNVFDYETLYALTQCTPDLSQKDCFNCLEDLMQELPKCCGNKIGARVDVPSCILRYEIYPFFNKTSNLPSLSPSPSPAPPPPSVNSSSPTQSKIGKGNNKTPKIAIIVIVLAAASTTIGICFYFLFRRCQTKEKPIVASPPRRVDEDDGSASNLSLLYKFDTLRIATNDFADFNKLGQGGFGAVYKGISAGQEIAVKRLSQNSGQGHTEFKSEVLLVAKLQHRNLVRLLGYCLEKEEKLLVYEFVPNTSLDQFLFDPERCKQLDWEKRYKIIIGITRGTLYLHEDSRLRIIHRDLKASNILLDADMNAKIADFGMAKLFGVDQTRGDTSKIAGTYGYMAPEYALHGFFSVKSDVYSFGVLVLEIITGKKCIGVQNGEFSEDLISYVWRNWSEGTHVNIIDPTLTTGSRTDMVRCIHIGLLCVQENHEDRPTMSSVLLMLSSHSLTLPVPSYPSFSRLIIIGADSNTGIISQSDSTSRGTLSVNLDSITEINTR